MTHKSITLCADDYGFNQAISSAIIELLNKKRINATSCMTNLPQWPEHAKALANINPGAQIGLHLNLTEGDHAYSLKPLIIKSLLSRLPYAEISRRIEQQFANFINELGYAPAFIDGHQHIHQLKGIRNIIIRCYSTYIKGDQCWVRLSANSVNKTFLLPFAQKQCIIYATGYRGLKDLLNTNRIPHNTSFAGVYDFEQYRNYREYFQQFLKQIDDNGLVMCHPGLNSHDPNDEIAVSRVAEYQYFNSEQYLQDCEEAGVKLA